MSVRTSVCLGERQGGFVQLFLKVVGEVQGSDRQIPNNYFDVFKHKEIFFEGKNAAQVAFLWIISTEIVCNEYWVLHIISSTRTAEFRGQLYIISTISLPVHKFTMQSQKYND